MKLLQNTLITICICIAGCQSQGSSSQKNNTTSQQNEIELILTADFTSDKEKLGKIYDFFDIAVRTERGNPKSKPATFGRKAKVNTVRMLGGWYNQDLTGDKPGITTFAPSSPT